MHLYFRKSKTPIVDSPVIITDSENEDYFSPTDRDKDLPETVTKRFPTDFTANNEDMIDLTVNSSNLSSGVQTPDSTQQSPKMAYPQLKLLDFLSPRVSPKDLAMSIKKQSGTTSPVLSSSVLEPASVELADVVPHYGVTARSPINSNETASVRQISPPQDPDELRRAVLLPLDKRVTTPVTAHVSSSTLISRPAIRKFDSPGSALTASIVQGTVSVRKDKYQKQPTQSSVNVSSAISPVSSSSNTDQQYKFSPPVEVLSPDKTSSGEGMNKGGRSPNVSFPFSPPLTRSQHRKTIEQESLNESRVKLFTSEVNMDPADDIAVAYAPKESGKKKARVSTAEVTTTTKTYHTR